MLRIQPPTSSFRVFQYGIVGRGQRSAESILHTNATSNEEENLGPALTHLSATSSLQSVAISLAKFNLNSHCTITNDQSIQADMLVIQPRQSGCKLVAQYYNGKYGTNITYPADIPDDAPNKSVLKQQTSPSAFFKTSYGVEQIDQVRALAASHENYRHAFLFGPARPPHDIPVIYIKENGEEAILIANSLGEKEGDGCHAALMAQRSYGDGKRLPVYAVPGQRQSDNKSCFIDALVFARDITGKDEKTGQFYIPDLLTKLKSQCSQSGSYYQVKLPSELLKTAQNKNFVSAHHTMDGQLIHENETLELFRDRYTEQVQFMYKSKPTFVSSYLRKKGIQAADLIEIQFYLNQINEQFSGGLPQEMKAQFIADAKQELKQQREQATGLSDHKSWTKLTKDHISSRTGLHDWAQGWVHNNI